MTELLRWTESLSTGHIELDGEHRRMVDLINQVRLTTCDANQRARHLNLLLELESLTEKHFEHEEAVLEELDTATPTGHRNLREMLAATKVEHAAEHRKRL